MSSASKSSSSEKALNGIGNLIKVLPTGTVFCYQILNPLLTNGGNCSSTNKIISIILFTICALSCFFSTFTDSYKDTKGKLHYGIATFKGFWQFSSDDSDSDSPSSSSKVIDYSSYKLQVGDFVHGIFALNIFGVISLLDTNTVECFYPSFASNQKALLMVLPTVLGSVSGTVFFLFPYKRHGIGYPSTLHGSDQSEGSSDDPPPPSSNDQDQKVNAANGDQKV